MMTTDADIWSAHVNPANGLTYYYNSVSQESTYVAPPHLQKKPAEAALAPPETPKRVQTLRRSGSFVSTDGQLALLSQLRPVGD